MDKDLEILIRIKDKYPELICSQEDTYDEVKSKCKEVDRILKQMKEQQNGR